MAQGKRLPLSMPFAHEANLATHGHTSVMVQWADVRRCLLAALPEGGWVGGWVGRRSGLRVSHATLDVKCILMQTPCNQRQITGL